MRCRRSRCVWRWVSLVAVVAVGTYTTHRLGRASTEAPRIAFLQWSDGYWQLFVMDADGASPRQLTTSPVDKLAPSWCPEPQILHFATASGDSLLYDLYQDAALPILPGSGLTPLCEVDGQAPVWVQEVQAPAWVPDNQILVLLRRASAELYPEFEVRALELEDVLARADVPRAARNVLTESGELVYVSDRGGDPQVWIASGDGQSPRALSDVQGPVRNPALSPDGTWLVFESEHEGSAQIYRVDLVGGPLLRLTDGASPARSAVMSWPESEALP